MTCENNKKGCNNKILIHTWMLASMVCMLSVSDMLGMLTPKRPTNPYEVMKRIKGDPKYYKEFMKIFKGHEKLIKRNCCCGDIDIQRTLLPKDLGNDSNAAQLTVYEYIHDRFAIHHDIAFFADDWNAINAECGALDNLIKGIYKAPSAS